MSSPERDDGDGDEETRERRHDGEDEAVAHHVPEEPHGERERPRDLRQQVDRGEDRVRLEVVLEVALEPLRPQPRDVDREEDEEREGERRLEPLRRRNRLPAGGG